jgi:transposase
VISSTPQSSAEIDISALTARLKLLEEENRWLKAQLFGRSSEKTAREDLHPSQAWLFNEAEALATVAETAPASVMIRAHPRLKHGRKRLDPALPRIDVIHDISEAEKRCAADGMTLERIGEEISEQLDYQPAKIRVIRNIRPKYACPCCRQGIKIAPVPLMLFPKSIATPALLAQITAAKFVDHVPLYRQETQFGRLRVCLGRATMAGWMIRLGATHVVPIINLLVDRLLEAPLIHCDETRLQVLNSDKSPAADHWMWVRAAGPPGRRIILFDYDPSRGGAVPRRLLEGYRGILLTDGYEAYAKVALALGLVHAGCMAHARRAFDEAHKAQLTDTPSHAKIALDFIRELYRIEGPLWDRDHPVTAEQRVRIRAERSAPVIDRFHRWLDGIAPQVVPQSRLGRAVHYTLGQWAKLTIFLNHGEVPLDNNRCENAIRPFVVGRKGWLFSDTVAGAKASASLFSLVETCKANGIEPHAYLSRLFERLPHLRTVDDFESMLPWNVKIPLAAIH